LCAKLELIEYFMESTKARIKNQSIAEYAKIRIQFLSGTLTAMLAINAIGITVSVSLLDTTLEGLSQAGFLLLLFSTLTSILLFFLAKRYIESISHRFIFIETDQMDAISRVAKRFYKPFLLSLVANMLLAFLGGASLLLPLFI
jgi:hypothetical protein